MWIHRACWCSVIIASLPVFGEITAVVCATNKVPRGIQHPDPISHKWSACLKGDFFFFAQSFVALFNTSYCVFLNPYRGLAACTLCLFNVSLSWVKNCLSGGQ